MSCQYQPWTTIRLTRLGKVYEVKVSNSDLALIGQYKWHVSGRDNHLFAQATLKGRNLLMHRLICDCPPEFVVDHKNHDPLDNRRENLRPATQKQNAQNMSRHRDSRSPYKGVYKHGERWTAKINNRLIGVFPTAEHAALAYNDQAKQRFRDFACPNELNDFDEAALRKTMHEGARKRTSSFQGVSFVPACRKPWRAVKRWRGKDYRLGFFQSELLAALAVDSFCLTEGLDARHMNFPDWPAIQVARRGTDVHECNKVVWARIRQRQRLDRTALTISG